MLKIFSKTSFILVFLCGSYLFLGWSSTAIGQTSFVGSETLANTTTANTQQNAVTAMDTAGRFIVVWESEDQDGDDYGIYASIFDKTGAVAVAEFAVNTTTIESQRFPSVACDANGNFVIVWMSEEQDGDAWGIYSRRYSIDGTALSGEVKINATTSGQQKFPHVAMNAKGSYAVTWTSIIAGSQEILTRFYAADGLATTSDLATNTFTTGNQSNSRIAMDSLGRAVVVWQSSGQDGSGNGVYGQRYAADGSFIDSEFLVNTETDEHQQEPDVDMKNDGSFVVVWSSYAQDGDSYGIYGQRYLATGAAEATEFGINITVAGSQNNASVCVADSGFFVVTWNSYGQDGSFDGVYLMEYNPFGEKYGTETQVNTTTADFQQFPEISFTKDDLDMVIVWQGGERNNTTTNDGSKYGVYFQLGNIRDKVDPIAQCVASHSVNLDANGDFTLVPADLDNGSTDNSGLFTLSLSQAALTCSDIGTPTITLWATDAAGNKNSCDVVVTISDVTKPTVVTQNITVSLDATGNVTIVAADVNNGSSDACGIATLGVSPSAFTCSEIGANTVTLTVTDNNGNSDFATATVTVQDLIKPTVVTQNITIALDGTGNATIVASAVNNGSSDICGVATLAVSPSAFTCSDIGANTVTLTVTDNNGNSDFATATVTVTMTTPSITGTTADSRCDNGVLNLSATADEGTIKWYDAATAGNLVHTGANYSPTLSSTTSFWVQADNACNSSARTEVIATVYDCSKLAVGSCGTTLAEMNSALNCEVVSGATDYRYWVQHPASGFSTISVRGAADNLFRLSWISSGIQHGTTYDVRVSAYVSGVWEPYGDVCTLTTPATKLQNASCGISISDHATALYSFPVTGATNYKYLVENTASGFSQVSVRGTADNLFRLSWFSSGIEDGRTYDIRVSAYVSGAWQAFGPICQVSTLVPLTKLTTASCGSAVASLTEALYCNPVAGATNYRYLVTTSGFSAISLRGSSSTLFRLNWVTGTSMNKTYTIKVAALVNGVWGEYGSACTVTCTSLATQLASGSCGITVPSMSTALYSDPVSGATNYKYELVSSGNPTIVATRGAADNLFRLSWVSGIQFNTTYSIRVSAYASGAWQTYAAVCTVTTPASMIAEDTRTQEWTGGLSQIELNVFPNPSQGKFTIRSSHEGQFKLINELGQLIQVIQISKENNYETDIKGLANGMYYITGTINNEVITKKVVVAK